MEPFLKSYYDHFKYQTIDSYKFKEYFLKYFKDKDLSEIDWDKWYNGLGMADYEPDFDLSLVKVSTTFLTQIFGKNSKNNFRIVLI